MLFFLVFFWVVVDQMQVRHRYELEGAMLGPATAWTESTDISDISTMDDVWDWLKVAAVPLVFPVEQWYNGEAWTAKEKGFLLNFNRLVGGKLQATLCTNHHLRTYLVLPVSVLTGGVFVGGWRRLSARAKARHTRHRLRALQQIR